MHDSIREDSLTEIAHISQPQPRLYREPVPGSPTCSPPLTRIAARVVSTYYHLAVPKRLTELFFFKFGTTLHTEDVHAIICAPRPENHIVMACTASHARASKRPCAIRYKVQCTLYGGGHTNELASLY